MVSRRLLVRYTIFVNLTVPPTLVSSFCSAVKFLVSGHGYLFKFFKVFNDASYPVHIDANDLAYILLRNSRQPKLNDHEVMQQLVCRLPFLFLWAHVRFLSG